MDHYINILIQPDAEIRLNVLLNTLYAKLHKALHDSYATNIGVSFPKYNIMLGNVLRLHGERLVLQKIMDLNWIGGMTGYCNVSSIISVPEGTKFRTVSRKQSTMSQSKLKRLIKRSSIAEEEIGEYKTKMISKGLDNPYIEFVSGSNGHKHRRYIEFGELLDQPVYGKFDQFGFSKTATIPWFD